MPLTLGMLAVAAAEEVLPLDCIYGSNLGNTSDLATYTMSLQFGPADPDRIVVVGIGTARASGTVPVPTVTIGGIAAELINKVDNTTYSTMMFAAKVPTGTSGNVVAAYGATMTASYMATWSIYGGAEVQPGDSAASAAVNGAISDRYALGATIQYVFATSSTSGWTNGLVEDFDFAQTLGSNHAGAHIENVADGSNLVYSVVNSGFYGTVVASWKPSGSIPNSAPVNVSLPVITGGAYNGGVLACSTGSWDGYPLPTFTYQWTLDGVNIPGANATTYTCVADDVGKSVGCKVTATNIISSVTATAASVTVAEIAMPVVIGSPTEASSNNFSHTVVAGTKCLVVRYAGADEDVVSGPTTCSWNGQAMTRGAYCYGSYNNNGSPVVIFYLMNPAPGTGNVTFSSVATRSRSRAENWDRVSGIGANQARTASTSGSSFSFTFNKTTPLNVLIAAASLRAGTSCAPGANNIEEMDAGTSQPTHRLYFGRAETTNVLAASIAGGANTFGACGLELVAG